MGSTGTPKGTGIVSNVDTRTTPMSAEDINQVSGSWSTGYFQTATAFDINNVLRTAAEKNEDVSEAMANRYPSKSAELMKTINAMDRNMHPTDKDMQLLRLTGDSYTEKVFNALGIDSKITDAVHDMKFRGNLGKNQDTYIAELREKMIGARIEEPSYMSCTYNLSLTDSAFKSRRVALEIEAPRGTRGMFSPTKQESEFVMARGSSYNVTDVYFDDKSRRLVFKVRMNT